MASILGMGNPLLDISAVVKPELLTKYGLKLNDAILATDAHKSIYEDLVKDYDVDYIAGGSTQNTIRVAQWMLQETGATAFIGCIGKDEFGEQLKKSAGGDGVTTHYRVDDKVATGTCAVLVVDKERSMVTDLLAANEYKNDHLNNEEITKVWTEAKSYYIAGFFLTVSPESVLQVGEHAAQKNKIFSMNLSAEFITQVFNEPLVKSLVYCDFVFGNESEAKAFGEKMGYEDTSVKGVALEIAKMAKTNTARERNVVFTQGADPTVVVCGTTVTEYPVPPLEASQIVDVNGAGDAFVGGFLSALSKGSAIADCVAAGHYSASVILGVSGTKLSGTPDAAYTTPMEAEAEAAPEAEAEAEKAPEAEADKVEPEAKKAKSV